MITKYLPGTRQELEAIRAEAEAKLGYPKAPDFVGKNVRDPQPTIHAFAIVESKNGYVLTVTKELEDIAKTDVLKTTKEALITKLAVAIVEYESKAVAIAEPIDERLIVDIDVTK